MTQIQFQFIKTYFLKLGFEPGTLGIFFAETAESVNSELADSVNFTYVWLIPHNLCTYIKEELARHLLSRGKIAENPNFYLSKQYIIKRIIKD